MHRDIYHQPVSQCDGEAGLGLRAVRIPLPPDEVVDSASPVLHLAVGARLQHRRSVAEADPRRRGLTELLVGLHTAVGMLPRARDGLDPVGWCRLVD